MLSFLEKLAMLHILKDIRKKDEDFFFLCSQGSLEEVVTAIRAGANVNASYNGKTALENVMWYGIEKQEIALALINAGAKINKKTAMLDASDSPKLISALIKLGADVNAKSDYDLGTPLMNAAADVNINPDVISMLIQAGADVNVKTTEGKTALMYIVSRGDVEVEFRLKRLQAVNMLIQAGADVNLKDKHGFTALFYSVLQYYHSLEIVKTLVKAGAVIDDNSISYAPTHGDYELKKFFLESIKNLIDTNSPLERSTINLTHRLAEDMHQYDFCETLRKLKNY